MNIIKKIKQVPEVVEVSGVFGVYDIIVRISSDDMDKLREIITWNIRKIDKVRSTLTMIVIEGQGQGTSQHNFLQIMFYCIFYNLFDIDLISFVVFMISSSVL